jgi:pimeloyl-ACP methyl ester carboxylesterase
MRLRIPGLVLASLLGLLLLTAAPALAAPAGTVVTTTGVIDGAPFQIQVPAPWNGTLVLWSHGYQGPGTPRTTPADAPDPVSQQWLLAHGYALAASDYSQAGWAIQQALHDQIAVLDKFNALGNGRPKRTIAWGASLGGIITAGLLQDDPTRFTGAIPLCGVLAGGVGVWNSGLDGQFAFKTLLGGSAPLQLVNITGNPFANFQLAESLLSAAQGTPQGRARLSLVAAISDTPGWFQTGSPQPAATDFAAREQNQFLWDSQVDFAFSFALRQELEARAGGNPSWNTGVDYRDLLGKSVNRDEVRALYRQAGLSLDADLETLENAPRIAADPGALDYLKRFIVFDGKIRQPVLTMHTIGDGLVLNQDEQAYASVVRAAGKSSLLRQTFINRAGHCAFQPAELVAAFKTEINRLDTGRWSDSTDPADMNATAASLGLGGSAFVAFRPSVFLRPFDARNTHGDGGGGED